MTSDAQKDYIISMRTTLDIDKPILDELKELGRREKKSLGQVASELLAASLAQRSNNQKESPKLLWNAMPMKPLVDINDKDALYRTLDQNP